MSKLKQLLQRWLHRRRYRRRTNTGSNWNCRCGRRLRRDRGENGATATVNHADVTSAGQLLTTEANPNTFVQSGDIDLGTVPDFTVIAKPKTSDALIITTIHLDVFADPTPGGNDYIVLYVGTGSTCGSQVGSWDHYVDPATMGEIDIPYAPGLVVAKGDALCGFVSDAVEAEASVSGYNVSSTDAPTAAVHPLALSRQK